MKFAIKITILLFAIGLFETRRIKKKNSTKMSPLVFPAEEQANDPEVVKKAKDQNDSARNLLKNPGKTAKGILTAVATNMKGWYNNIKDEDIVIPREEFDLKSDFNRGLYIGIMMSDEEVKSKFTQLAAIGKVSNGSGDGIENAGVLALCGDIGTAILDYNSKKASPKYENIINVMSSKTSIQKSSLMEMAKSIKGERGGSAIAPKKKAGLNGNPPAERGEIKNNDEVKIDKRSGVFNIGNDNFAAKWPWQTIPKNYITNCKEPWAGHYSGSIVEVLFVMDLFTKANNIYGQPPEISFDYFRKNTANASVIADMKNSLDSKIRQCKAALAGAFLISIGYHSAIEVKPTIYGYLGRTMPKIFTDDSTPESCDNTASADLVKLMDACNSTNDA